jgi:hypothetical protein
MGKRAKTFIVKFGTSFNVPNSPFARSIRRWLPETSRLDHGLFPESATKHGMFWLVRNCHTVFLIRWCARPTNPPHSGFSLDKTFEIHSYVDCPDPRNGENPHLSPH